MHSLHMNCTGISHTSYLGLRWDFTYFYLIYSEFICIHMIVCHHVCASVTQLVLIM
jgi:hypothetical protein